MRWYCFPLESGKNDGYEGKYALGVDRANGDGEVEEDRDQVDGIGA